MDVKASTIYVVDGDTGSGRLESERRFTHVPLKELPLDKLPEDAFAILNLQGEERQQVLGAFFRQKRPFALGGIGGVTKDELMRLCETAHRKKARAWVIGGYRMLPIVAAVKEVITGGCLGELKSLSVHGDYGIDLAQDTLLVDATIWMCREKPRGNSSIIPSMKFERDSKRLGIVACGSAGGLEAACDLSEGRGWMKTIVNGHQCTRTFWGIDTVAMELNLLASLVPVGVGILPGVVPLAELTSAFNLLQLENGR